MRHMCGWSAVDPSSNGGGRCTKILCKCATQSAGGSVVECSPSTRATWVRFPANAPKLWQRFVAHVPCSDPVVAHVQTPCAYRFASKAIACAHQFWDRTEPIHWDSLSAKETINAPGPLQLSPVTSTSSSSTTKTGAIT
ncbi:hypothetical protein KIN20_016584 [Parelaphostrongylus tenuis]|uniref:Uncharacterized protein n=1 Tax=Parelaphostrongylus tenuis TaxID=148309 RepID=A0AAD5MYT4_PARTN|nr:hypothetical protein KIN20_016584 [Parelaphostrongylus tenuis]